MITLHSHDPALPDQQEAFPSSLVDIERGLSHLVQGRFIEGLELLRQASLPLSAREAPLAAALDGLQEASNDFLQAQQRLYESSRRFADAERKWQERIETLNELLRDHHTSARTPGPSEGSSSQQRLRQPSTLRLPVPLAGASASHLVEMTPAHVPPPLYINCFGHFVVRRFHASGPEIPLCRNSRGQAIMRYLLAQPEHYATLDMLMAALWPEEDPQVARHKLQVAISALRCSLNYGSIQAPGAGYILYKERLYQLNPAIEFHTDVTEFYRLHRMGQRADRAAVTADCYEQACKLYTGPFLAEDLYAEWSFLAREEADRVYLTMCGWLAEHCLANGDYETSLAWTAAILKVDRCNEEAYRQSMRALAASGKRSEALRRYQQCRQALAEELEIQPAPETRRLWQALIQGQ